MDVKILDGATYTIVKRNNPKPGEGVYYWLGDNGRELELTEKETAELLRD